jgi:hypothetical protein
VSRTAGWRAPKRLARTSVRQLEDPDGFLLLVCCWNRSEKGKTAGRERLRPCQAGKASEPPLLRYFFLRVAFFRVVFRAVFFLAVVFFAAGRFLATFRRFGAAFFAVFLRFAGIRFTSSPYRDREGLELRCEPLQASPLSLAESAPDAESLVVRERVLQTKRLHGALAADALRLP